MKEFLKDILIEPFIESDLIEYMLGILMWILTILILGGFIMLIGWFIDSSFLPLKEKEGIVIKRSYTPAHSTTTYITSGKVLIPVTNYIDDSYEIIIEIDGLNDNVSLDKVHWNNINVGDSLCCKYSTGRIYKSLYIKSFCNQTN